MFLRVIYKCHNTPIIIVISIALGNFLISLIGDILATVVIYLTGKVLELIESNKMQYIRKSFYWKVHDVKVNLVLLFYHQKLFKFLLQGKSIKWKSGFELGVSKAQLSWSKNNDRICIRN